MLSRLKRSSALLVLFSILFSAGIIFLSIRQLHGEDSGVSGGSEGSTTIVTGTDDKCKEPGASTEECITHTHEYDTTTTDTDCSPAGRIKPSGGESYCVSKSITYSLTKTGENIIGKRTTTYGPCKICGASYPGTNPEISDHDVTFPSNPNWSALDCGANPASGSGETASFVANAPSPSVNGSSVVFKFDDGLCKTHCGKLVIGPYTVNFTVVGVKSISAALADIATVTSTTDAPGDDQSICVDQTDEDSGALKFSALPDPDGATWPTDNPEWYVGSNKVATGEAFTFKGGDYDVGVYDVAAQCGTSVKKIKVYVVIPRYQVFSDEPSPGSGKPIDAFSPANMTYSVGHAWWKLFAVPVEANSIIPFKQYDIVINKPVGFYGNETSTENVFTGKGSISAPLPSLHVPDISHAQTASKFYNISIVNALLGLKFTKGINDKAGDYILAYKIFYASVPEIDWNYKFDKNCSTTAVTAGTKSNAPVPSAYDEWTGNVGGLICIFYGNSPGFLGPRL